MGAAFSNTLLDILRDPVSGQALSFDAKAKLLQSVGGKKYPLLSQKTFCLLPRPELALAHFHSQWNLLRSKLDAEIDQQQQILAKQLAGMDAATKARIELSRRSRIDFKKELEEIFSALPNHSAQGAACATKEVLEAVGLTIPVVQPLIGYPQNLFRDWVWGQPENAAYLKICNDLVSADSATKPKRVLVIASGAGRLAYDLHRNWNCQLTVAMDNSYFFSEVFQRVVGSAGLRLSEFPAAPKDDSSRAVRHQIDGQNFSGELHFILGDLNYLPFCEAAFDCVVTPWILDLIPAQVPQLLHNIGALLKKDGVWVNFGSFQISDETPLIFQYSRDEIKMLAARSGMTWLQEQNPSVDYLKSPHSAHSRVEELWAFAARRNDEGPLSLVRSLGTPPWLLDLNAPIPRVPQVDFSEMMNKVPFRVYSLIDGKRSLKDIAVLIAQEFSMGAAEAEASLVGFLSRWAQDVRFRS